MSFKNPYTFFTVLPSVALFALNFFILYSRRKKPLERSYRSAFAALMIAFLLALSLGCILMFAISSTGMSEMLPEAIKALRARLQSGYPFDDLEMSVFWLCCLFLPVTYATSIFTLWKLSRSGKRGDLP